jgi:hypothetical protein
MIIACFLLFLLWHTEGYQVVVGHWSTTNTVFFTNKGITSMALLPFFATSFHWLWRAAVYTTSTGCLHFSPAAAPSSRLR